MAGAGGCDFLEHPARNGMNAFVFWRADALARHVRLTPAPESVGDSLVRFEPARWGSRQSGRTTPDGYHLIVSPSGGIEHHLLFTDPDPPPIGTRLMPVPAFDAWHPERLEATLAFWRFAHQPRVSPAPRVKSLPPTVRTLESAFLVWTLDLARYGASDREIALALFGVPPRNWEDSGARSMVRRFIAKAEAYAAGKYRLLLKPRRSPFASPPTS